MQVVVVVVGGGGGGGGGWGGGGGGGGARKQCWVKMTWANDGQVLCLITPRRVIRM